MQGKIKMTEKMFRETLRGKNKDVNLMINITLRRRKVGTISFHRTESDSVGWNKLFKDSKKRDQRNKVKTIQYKNKWQSRQKCCIDKKDWLSTSENERTWGKRGISYFQIRVTGGGEEAIKDKLKIKWKVKNIRIQAYVAWGEKCYHS